jgi:hypothetical protein
MYTFRSDAQNLSTFPTNAPFTQLSNNFQGTQPSQGDRKNYIKYNSAFAGTQTLVLSSSNRMSGSIASAVFRLPNPMIAYACSLKSLTLPVSWPNLLNAVPLTVTYNPSNPESYPTSINIPAGSYSYDLNQGLVTYAYVHSQASSVNQNDLVWTILRLFQGAVVSININPTNGSWIWAWDTTGGVTSVTSTSTAALPGGFFNIASQTAAGVTWSGAGLVDLTGPKTIMVNCPELDSNAYLSMITTQDSYICSLSVDKTFGEVIIHEPKQELVNYFCGEKPISQLSITIMDSATNTVLPLQIDYSMEIRFYVSNPLVC